MNRMFWTAMVAAAALLPSSVEAQRVADLAWLGGTWRAETGSGWTEERWSAPHVQVMLGTNLSATGARIAGYEFLRIAPDREGRVTLFAAPGGGAATPFRLARADARSAVFENPRNDFPQRISYRRDGRRLVATISMMDGTRSVSWSFRRLRCD